MDGLDEIEPDDIKPQWFKKEQLYTIFEESTTNLVIDVSSSCPLDGLSLYIILKEEKNREIAHNYFVVKKYFV